MAVVTPVRIRDWTFSCLGELGEIKNLASLFLFFAFDKVVIDSLAERSKAPDSSSGGAILVGSNPTAVIDFLLSGICISG